MGELNDSSSNNNIFDGHDVDNFEYEKVCSVLLGQTGSRKVSNNKDEK